MSDKAIPPNDETLEKINECWSKGYCWRNWCNGCKDWHDSFWKTVIESPQWHAWADLGMDAGFDTPECEACGHISQKHFQAFLKFVKKENRLLRKSVRWLNSRIYPGKGRWRR